MQEIERSWYNWRRSTKTDNE